LIKSFRIRYTGDWLEKKDIKIAFSPGKLKSLQKNEILATVKLSNNSDKYCWYEFDVNLNSPLSLTYDQELDKGRFRVGILEPKTVKGKDFKIFTMDDLKPGIHKINFTIYVYDGDAVISDRLDYEIGIESV